MTSNDTNPKKSADKNKKQRQPWPLFFTKVAVMLSVMIGGGCYLLERYTVGLQGQDIGCLDSSVYVVDKWDKKPMKNKLFAFSSQGMAPFFKDGEPIIKILRGMPGDTIEVTERETFVNGFSVADKLWLLKTVDRPASDFVRKEIIPKGEYAFFGTTPNSFDSRYWGYVKEEKIVGRVYEVM